MVRFTIIDDGSEDNAAFDALMEKVEAEREEAILRGVLEGLEKARQS